MSYYIFNWAYGFDFVSAHWPACSKKKAVNVIICKLHGLNDGLCTIAPAVLPEF